MLLLFGRIVFSSLEINEDKYTKKNSQITNARNIIFSLFGVWDTDFINNLQNRFESFSLAKLEPSKCYCYIKTLSISY
jgi:hypothetical protein